MCVCVVEEKGGGLFGADCSVFDNTSQSSTIKDVQAIDYSHFFVNNQRMRKTRASELKMCSNIHIIS